MAPSSPRRARLYSKQGLVSIRGKFSHRRRRRSDKPTHGESLSPPLIPAVSSRAEAASAPRGGWMPSQGSVGPGQDLKVIPYLSHTPYRGGGAARSPLSLRNSPCRERFPVAANRQSFAVVNAYDSEKMRYPEDEASRQARTRPMAVPAAPSAAWMTLETCEMNDPAMLF